MAESGDDYLEIDGSILEGGGQILRITACLSAILKRKIHVRNIRAGRSKPGLRPQHLQGLRLIAKLCDGKLTGGKIGSVEVWLEPQVLRGGKDLIVDTETAGAVTLLMQVCLPCLAFTEKPNNSLVLKGGTNVPFAPQIEYTQQIFKPMAERFGMKFECQCLFNGFMPKGNGEVEVKTTSKRPRIFSFKAQDMTDRGEITRIFGRAWTAGSFDLKFAVQMAKTARAVLKEAFPDIPVAIDPFREYDHIAKGSGCGIIIGAESENEYLLGADALGGGRDSSPIELGEVAAKQLIVNINHGGCVDQQLQDQCAKLSFQMEDLAVQQFNVAPEEPVWSWQTSRTFDWYAFVETASVQTHHSNYEGYDAGNAHDQFEMVKGLADMAYGRFDITLPPRELEQHRTPTEFDSMLDQEVAFWVENFLIKRINDEDRIMANKYINAVRCLRMGHFIYHRYKKYGKPMWSVVSECEALDDAKNPFPMNHFPS